MGEKKLENNILYLKINLKDINNIETSNVIKLNQKGNVCIAFLGNIYNDKLDRVSIDEIYDLYKKFGTNIKKYLDGIYTLLILDYTKWKMYIFQDDFGSNQNVYYYISNNVITISNQLKQIILDNKVCGVDMFNIAAGGVFESVTLPETLENICIAVKGRRHTYRRMAQSPLR